MVQFRFKLLMLLVLACLVAPAFAATNTVQITNVQRTADYIVQNGTIKFDVSLELGANKTVDDVWGAAVWPGKLKNFTLSSQSNLWTANFVNTSDAGTYTFTFYANTSDGNKTSSQPMSVTVYKKLASTSSQDELKALVDFTSSIFDSISVKKDGSVPPMVLNGVEYKVSFTKSGAYNITLPMIFNGTIKPKITTADAPSVTVSKIDFMDQSCASFTFHYDAGSGADVCFDASKWDGDNETRAITAHCPSDNPANCITNSSWTLKSGVSKKGYCATGLPTKSIYILSECKQEYFCDGKCKTTKCPTTTTADNSKKSTDEEKDEVTIERAAKKKEEPKITRANESGKNETSKKSDGITGAFSLIGLKGSAKLGAIVGIIVAACVGAYFGRKYYLKRKGRKVILDDGKSDKKKGKDDEEKTIHNLLKANKLTKANWKNKEKLKAFLEVALELGHDSADLKLALKYRGVDKHEVEKLIKEIRHEKRDKAIFGEKED